MSLVVPKQFSLSVRWGYRSLPSILEASMLQVGGYVLDDAGVMLSGYDGKREAYDTARHWVQRCVMIAEKV